MNIKTISDMGKGRDGAVYIDLPLVSCIGAAVLGSLAATCLGAGFYLFVLSVA